MEGGPGLPRDPELLGSTELRSGLRARGWQRVRYMGFFLSSFAFPNGTSKTCSRALKAVSQPVVPQDVQRRSSRVSPHGNERGWVLCPRGS